MKPSVFAIVQFDKRLTDNAEHDKVARIRVGREMKEEMHALEDHPGAYFIMVGPFENDVQAQKARKEMER